MAFSEEIQAEIGALSADLTREDELGAVVRAHIRIESLLIQVVESLVLRPPILRKLNFDYDEYVTLALALGVDERFGPPLRVLGKIRNDFAHKLDTTLSKQSARNLYNALSAEDKQRVQGCFERIKSINEQTRDIKRFSDLEPTDQFKILAITLWAAVRSTAMRQEAARQHSRSESHNAITRDNTDAR